MTTPIQHALRHWHSKLPEEIPIEQSGMLTRIVGLSLEASGIRASIGSRCLIEQHLHQKISFVEAEVIGFTQDKTLLMPIQETQQLQPGARVHVTSTFESIMMGDGLLGRVVDGMGQALDGKPLPTLTDPQAWIPGATNPMERKPIIEPLDVGVQSINALLTVGQGQRMGLFAGSGVGKSVLLGMMSQFTSADVTVIGLIGERGREVKEFIEHNLTDDSRKRSVVVAAPADQPPLLRLHAAYRACAIAEYFRAQGKHVLLLMDSLTRFAQAQREIGLSAGEPPATKGYPPSVFSKIPQLIERAGQGKPHEGSITAFYTVLVEGDDLQDPIGDCARSVLDGHVVLSRELADRGHFPSIEIEGSISRLMNYIASPEHQIAAQQFRKLYSRYKQSKDLIEVGAYVKGSDKELDLAIERLPEMMQFLKQHFNQPITLPESIQHLYSLSQRLMPSLPTMNLPDTVS